MDEYGLVGHGATLGVDELGCFIVGDLASYSYWRRVEIPSAAVDLGGGIFRFYGDALGNFDPLFPADLSLLVRVYGLGAFGNMAPLRRPAGGLERADKAKHGEMDQAFGLYPAFRGYYHGNPGLGAGIR